MKELKIFNDKIIEEYDFFTGVPDSALKNLIKKIDQSEKQHVVAVNEGQAIAIAFGAMLAGKKACVYMQNSGIGNAINPITSLCIPCGVCPFIIIGHRHTLEQHKIMGLIDDEIMKLIGYKNYYIYKGENNVK